MYTGWVLVSWRKAPVRIKSELKLRGLTGKLAEEAGKRSLGRRIFMCRGSAVRKRGESERQRSSLESHTPKPEEGLAEDEDPGEGDRSSWLCRPSCRSVHSLRESSKCSS